MPEDYSDIGQAKVLACEYGGELVFTDATDYMRYDGIRWAESKQLAVGVCEDFLDKQLNEAKTALEKAQQALIKSALLITSLFGYKLFCGFPAQFAV